MTDPGFPRRGRDARNQGRGANLLFGQILSRKLHENERNWIQGDRAPPAPPLDPPVFGEVNPVCILKTTFENDIIKVQNDLSITKNNESGTKPGLEWNLDEI